jgi:hypothetical protein
MGRILEPPIALAIVGVCLLAAVGIVAWTVWAHRRALRDAPIAADVVAATGGLNALTAKPASAFLDTAGPLWTPAPPAQYELTPFSPATGASIRRGLARRRWPDEFPPLTRTVDPSWPEADELFVGELELPPRTLPPATPRAVTCVGGVVREWELTS